MFKVGDKVVFNKDKEGFYLLFDIDPSEPMKVVDLCKNSEDADFPRSRVQYKEFSSGRLLIVNFLISNLIEYQESTKHPHYDLIVKWGENPSKYKILSKNKNETDWRTGWIQRRHKAARRRVQLDRLENLQKCHTKSTRVRAQSPPTTRYTWRRESFYRSLSRH